jgi:predicted lactoylglutathione lyase
MSVYTRVITTGACMSKQIFINLPVSDLEKSTTFYQALGFEKNDTFSNESASSMMWSDTVIVMLLKHDFYQSFIAEKEIADTKKTSSALLALTLDTKDAVQQFADTAKQYGGDYYQVDSGVPSDMMFGYEVQDPDGHTWEPVWMNAEFEPHTKA